jgi:hypothetical protein
MIGRSAVGVLGVAALAVAPLAGQGLTERIGGVDDGWVTFRVEVRDGVEICDRGIRWYRDDGTGRGHRVRGGDPDEGCAPGPLQVELRVRDGRVQALETARAAPRSGAWDLGPVDPLEASDFLVALAYRGASEDAVREGLFLSRLPRGADPSQGILRVARDRSLPSEVRRSGLFWAGQLATEAVVRPLGAVAVEEGPDQEVREAAVFALSQHQGDAAVPVLMELAVEAPHAGTRESALFWLAQRDEPEIADFFADLILGRRGG